MNQVYKLVGMDRLLNRAEAKPACNHPASFYLSRIRTGRLMWVFGLNKFDSPKLCSRYSCLEMR